MQIINVKISHIFMLNKLHSPVDTFTYIKVLSHTIFFAKKQIYNLLC